MSVWKYKINIASLWKQVKDDEILPWEFVEKFLNILKSHSCYDENDLDLQDIVEYLEDFVMLKNTDKNDFDLIWDNFYDWADEKRVWIAI